jgi:hypothetical protein
MHSFFHHTDHHHHRSNSVAKAFHIDHKPKHITHFQPVKTITHFQPVKTITHLQPIKSLFQPVKPISHFQSVGVSPAPPQNSNSQPEQPKTEVETLKPSIQSTFSNFLESDSSYILYGVVGLGVIVYIFKK